MSDFFKLLATGAKFDRRKAVKIDQSHTATSQDAGASSSHAAVAARPSGGAGGAGAAKPKRKKHKKGTKKESKAEADIDLFGRRQRGVSDDEGAPSGSDDDDDDDDDDERRHVARCKRSRGAGAEGADEEVKGGCQAAGESKEEEEEEERIVVAGVELAAVDADVPSISTRDPWEEANVIRKAFGIKVTGGPSVPPPLRSFAELVTGHGASRRLLANLVASGGYTQPTPIQRQAAPVLLAGRELLAVAPTGSGKTLAFLLPIMIGLKRLRVAGTWPAGPKALVLSPTQELTAQQARVLKLLLPGSGLSASVLSKATAAGTDFSRVDVLLANPLRLATMAAGGAGTGSGDAAANGSGKEKQRTAAGEESRSQEEEEEEEEEEGREGAERKKTQSKQQEGGSGGGAGSGGGRSICLSEVRYLVLDEADKLFEAGFMEQIDGVLAACSNKDLVRALFSATLPEQVEDLARSVLQQPVRVVVGLRNSAVPSVKQRLVFVGGDNGKLLALKQLMADGLKPPVLVFVSSKDRAKALHRDLLYAGLRVDSLSAGMPHAARAAAVDNFRLGATWILIATDLIGRGMDFAGVNTVVNYDFPSSTADYIHRIGRTGRAGRSGEAVTFFAEDDAGQLRAIANTIRAAGCDVPDWMLSLKRERKKKSRKQRLPQALGSTAALGEAAAAARNGGAAEDVDSDDSAQIVLSAGKSKKRPPLPSQPEQRQDRPGGGGRAAGGSERPSVSKKGKKQQRRS